jgi:hypothetical protein
VTHVLKHVPAPRRYAESREVTQVNAFLRAPTKYVHGIVYKRSRVSFTCHWDVADAVKFGPGVRSRFVGPDIIEPGNAVSATEPETTVSSLKTTGQRKRTYKYSLSFQVTTEWLVRAGGALVCGEAWSFVLGSRTSQRLAEDCKEFKSNATRSLKKKPST